tara:strand:+ start:298 stop:444 length:147 start_codon:yes stop_codon:yes gene_type:complete
MKTAIFIRAHFTLALRVCTAIIAQANNDLAVFFQHDTRFTTTNKKALG